MFYNVKILKRSVSQNIRISNNRLTGSPERLTLYSHVSTEWSLSYWIKNYFPDKGKEINIEIDISVFNVMWVVHSRTVIIELWKYIKTLSRFQFSISVLRAVESSYERKVKMNYRFSPVVIKLGRTGIDINLSSTIQSKEKTFTSLGSQVSE